jgi:hypothetical protein
VAAVSALAAPLAWAMPGEQSLRVPSAFRNTFDGGPEGVAALKHAMDA